jgi:hypothetical protein
MNEDNKDIVINPDDSQDMDANEYVKQLEEIKKNTVSRSEYDRVVSENSRLIKGLAEQSNAEPDADKSNPVDLKKLAEDFLKNGKDMTNLQYIESMLEIRDEAMKQGYKDPFLPTGSHVMIDDQMVEKAQHVADAFEDCIESAEGDSGLFTAHLQRILKDPVIPRRR